MAAKLGVLVVGPGWVAGEHIKSYVQNPHTEIRVIAGMIKEDRPRAQAYMKEHDFHAEYSDDYQAALKRDDIDIVAVCTINFLHYRQGLAAIQAGKHTFVEKPLCFTMEEMKKLSAATKRRKVVTHVGHICRYYPACRGLWHSVREGAIGDIFYCEADYWHEIIGSWKVTPKTGGSALLMGGCHAVDMVRWMVGEEKQIKEVFAYSRKATWRKDFKYDPTICLMMRYKDGTIGKVATSLECNMPYVFHLQINGAKGTVRNNGLFSEKFPGQKDFMKIPADYPDDWDVAQHPFPVEVDYFVDCIRKKKESELSFPRALKTYEVIFAAERSAQSGKPVKLPL